MIEPMVKLWMICPVADRARLLDSVRESGCVHVVSGEPSSADDLEKCKSTKARYEKSLHALEASARGPFTAQQNTHSHIAVEDAVAEIERLSQHEQSLRAHRAALEEERRRIQHWGEFDPDKVRKMREGGVTFRLVEWRPGARPAVPPGFELHVVSRATNSVYGVLIGYGTASIDAAEIPLPERPLSELEKEIKECDHHLEGHRHQITTFCAYQKAITGHIHTLKEREEWLTVRESMLTKGQVAVLVGFCPTAHVAPLRHLADKYGWGIIAREPGLDDVVPTLVRHSRLTRPIKAVFDFIGVTPGYREWDISPLFLLFLSLFFAMIVGDAGYGMLFLIMTIAARRTLKTVPTHVWNLLGIMSVSTILWGLLSGNIFGIQAVQDRLGLAALKNEQVLMRLCFWLGAVQLTIAHLLRAVRLRRDPAALAQCGWIGTTWTMYYIACMLVLGRPFPPWMSPVFVVSVLLILVFMTPWARLRQDWFGHVMLPLNLVGNFVDVVSYVRLFAVGMATFALASAFNEMASMDGSTGWLARLASVLILFLGHALNILLAAMGVLVHGIRLNTLEFSSHLGLEWRGVPFRPFRRSTEFIHPQPHSNATHN